MPAYRSDDDFVDDDGGASEEAAYGYEYRPERERCCECSCHIEKPKKPKKPGLNWRLWTLQRRIEKLELAIAAGVAADEDEGEPGVSTTTSYRRLPPKKNSEG
jgi:hypothetical protein